MAVAAFTLAARLYRVQVGLSLSAALRTGTAKPNLRTDTLGGRKTRPDLHKEKEYQKDDLAAARISSSLTSTRLAAAPSGM